MKQYEQGFTEDEAYSLGDSILIRLNSKDNSTEFLGAECEHCGESIDEIKSPMYSVHKTFDDMILFHSRCFPEFVEDTRSVIRNNTHIYTSHNI